MGFDWCKLSTLCQMGILSALHAEMAVTKMQGNVGESLWLDYVRSCKEQMRLLEMSCFCPRAQSVPSR